MVTVGKYIETERVALLQTCRSMEPSTVSNTEHALCQPATAMASFLYIVFRQILFMRLKSTICHAENAQVTSLGMQ